VGQAEPFAAAASFGSIDVAILLADLFGEYRGRVARPTKKRYETITLSGVAWCVGIRTAGSQVEDVRDLL
jgi:hypothetical protein